MQEHTGYMKLQHWVYVYSLTNPAIKLAFDKVVNIVRKCFIQVEHTSRFLNFKLHHLRMAEPQLNTQETLVMNGASTESQLNKAITVWLVYNLGLCSYTEK